MNKITQEAVHDILSDCGFVAVPGKPNLFLVEEARTVTPAFYCRLLRRQGRVQLSGGAGLFFREFEKTWGDSISREERRIDYTLPIIMLISNYIELIEGNALRYYDLEGIGDAAYQIYNLIRRLPDSLEAFDKSLADGKLLGESVYKYFHIFDYHDSDSLYFRKSACFVHWFIEKYPQFSRRMRQSLTGRQLQRLGLQAVDPDGVTKH